MKTKKISTKLLQEVQKCRQASRAQSTRMAYSSGWRSFIAFCERQGQISLPAEPETVAAYMCHLMKHGQKAATIRKHMNAIAAAHRDARCEYPPTLSSTVRDTWEGITRTIGKRQHGKAALVTDNIRKICALLPDTRIGIRDRAVILLAFAAGGRRRSEVAAFDVADLEFVEEGLIVTVQYSKTDPRGESEDIGVPYGEHEETCPVRAVQRWLEISGVTDGPLFRAIRKGAGALGGRLAGNDVAHIIKAAVQAAGYDPRKFAGHSLRSGFCTAAAEAGAEEREIMEQSLHKSPASLRRYIRRGKLFKNNVAGRLGL